MSIKEKSKNVELDAPLGKKKKENIQQVYQQIPNCTAILEDVLYPLSLS